MKTLYSLVLVAMTFAIASAPQSNAQSDTGPRYGMIGGECPMMGAMGQGYMGRGMMRGRHVMGGRGMGRPRMGAMGEARLAFLKAELGITQEQEATWTEYAEAARNRISLMQGMHSGMMETMQEGTAVERMEARISGMEAMVESIKAVKPTVEKLYENLSNEQKKMADELIGIGCGAM